MRPILAAAFLPVLGACSQERAPAPAAAPAAVRAAAPASAPVPERAPRSQSAGVVALRRALEFGDVEQARALSAHAAEAGPEERLLQARLAILDGRAVEAMRLLEAAQAERPRDPDVWATAAEVYAARDAFDTAWAQIQAGQKACGETAEILRAKGVCWISRQNGAERGLAALEQARAADPALPFCDRALGQAHLLVGKLRVKEEKLGEALREARASLKHDPEDEDARRFLSDVLAGMGDFDGAIAEVGALVRQGRPLEAELALLHKRAGFAALLREDRAGAIDHFLEARARGLGDAELSSAAGILQQEAQKRVDAGVEAFGRGALDVAEEAFRRALDLDPLSLAAKNHLAVVRFRRGDPSEAARLWRGVLDQAKAERIDLPEPVHVNLAKAEVLRGDRAAAKAVLQAYLRDAPQGEWAGATRALLAQIEAEEK